METSNRKPCLKRLEDERVGNMSLNNFLDWNLHLEYGPYCVWFKIFQFIDAARKRDENLWKHLSNHPSRLYIIIKVSDRMLPRPTKPNTIQKYGRRNFVDVYDSRFIKWARSNTRQQQYSLRCWKKIILSRNPLVLMQQRGRPRLGLCAHPRPGKKCSHTSPEA